MSGAAAANLSTLDLDFRDGKVNLVSNVTLIVTFLYLQSFANTKT